MEHLTWNKQFETGNEKIDFEHRIFFGLIQSFACEMNDRHDPERLQRIFTEIRKYADFHFVSEQNVMADCAYPGLAEHARLHDELLRNLDDAIEAMHGEPGAYARFVVFLFEWFSYHTINEDRKIAEYIHRPG